METTYLGVVLTDDLSFAKDVERAKLAFFIQFNSLYQKFTFDDKNVMLHFSIYMQCRFTMLKPGISNSIKKTLKTFLYRIIKLSNVSVEETHMTVIMSVLSK